MGTILKRFGAYLIDYLIVTIIIYIVMLIPFFNPTKEAYNIKYSEVINVNEQFQKDEISEEEFNQAIIPIAYELYRLNISYVIISTICFGIYFIFVQFYLKGQTIGKKFFRLKIIPVKEKKLTLANYFVRAVVLYNLLIPILELLIVYMFKVDKYLPIYQNINLVGYIIMYINLFMILVRADGRGLHDVLANTKVVYDENLPLWNIQEKASNIVDAKITEVKNKENHKEKKTKPSKK